MNPRSSADGRISAVPSNFHPPLAGSTLRLFAFSAVWLIALTALLLTALPARADLARCVGTHVRRSLGEVGSVPTPPRDPDARRTLAESYASRGFIEEAIAQYLAILEQQPDNAEAPARINQLVSQRTPKWLPEPASRIAPFPHSLFDLILTDPVRKTPTAAHFLLIAPSATAEDDPRDPLHHWPFPHAQYAYAWKAPTSRWILKLRAHVAADIDAELATTALKGLASFHQTALVYASWDPTAAGRPIDLWITTQGAPGARSIGSSIYLYAASTQRTPAEWLREIAHEYGHIALPGIDGFTNSDDPWADGDLGELLLIKWLAASEQRNTPVGRAFPCPPLGAADGTAPASMATAGRAFPEPALSGEKGPPLALADAERIAAIRRRALIAAAAGKPNLTRLKARDTEARDYFLGLALRVEATAGPRFLAESLARCPRGTAADFVKAVSALAKERGVTLW